MSKRLDVEELHDACVDAIEIILSGHKTLRRPNRKWLSKEGKYRSAQRFCYGVVEKNVRDIHNFLYDHGKNVIYASPDAYPLKEKKKYRIEHSYPIVELASKWYENETIPLWEIIVHGIFNPIVKITKDEDSKLFSFLVDEPRKSPLMISEKLGPRKSCYRLAHTNPWYSNPMRRYSKIGLELRWIDQSNQLKIINGLQGYTLKNHLETIRQTRLEKLLDLLENTYRMDL